MANVGQINSIVMTKIGLLLNQALHLPSIVEAEICDFLETDYG